MTALYQILTGRRSSEAWEELKTVGTSTLATCSEDFRSALARLRDAHEDVLVPLEEVSARWLDAVRWPGNQLVGGLMSRLAIMAGWASRAIEKGNPLYCWFGPAVPEYMIVSGVGVDEYEAYRRNPGRLCRLQVQQQLLGRRAAEVAAG